MTMYKWMWMALLPYIFVNDKRVVFCSQIHYIQKIQCQNIEWKFSAVWMDEWTSARCKKSKTHVLWLLVLDPLCWIQVQDPTCTVCSLYQCAWLMHQSSCIRVCVEMTHHEIWLEVWLMCLFLKYEMLFSWWWLSPFSDRFPESLQKSRSLGHLFRMTFFFKKKSQSRMCSHKVSFVPQMQKGGNHMFISFAFNHTAATLKQIVCRMFTFSGLH